MSIRIVLLLALLHLFVVPISKATEKYHFGRTKGIEVSIKPDSQEFVAGSIATFTVTLKNKSRETIKINYPTGQQWDLVIYDPVTQIFRWSNGFTWHKSPHCIPLKPGEERSEKLSWVSVNKKGEPLLQGTYRCAGIVTSSPTKYISEKVNFRLTPPSVIAKEIIKTSLNQCFEIELPRYFKNQQLIWEIVYKCNDNRIEERFRRTNPTTFQISFKPKRLGHVEFDLYAYSEFANRKVSVERRSYRVEVE